MRSYKFKPQDDLTTKELAEIFIVIMNALIQGVSGRPWNPNEDLEIEKPIYRALPPDSKRHFELKDDESRQPPPETD